MRVQILLEQLQSAGFQLAISGEKLRVNPFSCLTPELRVTLREHRAELILALRICPYCRERGAQCEQTVREGLLYLDTRCDICGQIIETYVTANWERM